MPEPTLDGEQVTYGDWSNNSSDFEAWRLGKLSVASGCGPSAQDFELFITRPTKVLNTFQLTLSEDVARKLYELLKFHFAERA